jgi:hypothetical protein
MMLRWLQDDAFFLPARNEWVWVDSPLSLSLSLSLSKSMLLLSGFSAVRHRRNHIRSEKKMGVMNDASRRKRKEL